jgi:pyruvate,water dikinase
MIVTLDEAIDANEFGGKAALLSRARRAGLPVPAGFALSAAGLERALGGSEALIAELFAIVEKLGHSVAVRSSAIGEDGLTASFAGIHATALNVSSQSELREALALVHDSAISGGALAYRKKLGIAGEPRIGVVIQTLVPADSAGVMFTRHPVTGQDERVIEGSWGLGEAVVAGLVTPDHFRVARGGAILERRLGEKDVAVRLSSDGGTREVAVASELVERFCLSDAELSELDALASACEAHFGGTQDIEWAFAGGKLHLLQRRAITRA